MGGGSGWMCMKNSSYFENAKSRSHRRVGAGRVEGVGW